MVKRLIVYDFDWSMADQDSDLWIFESLDIELRRQFEKSVQDGNHWTDIMAQALRDAHSRGITRQQIETALLELPFHPAMVRAIKNTKAKGDTTFFCLSNANSIFISTILELKGLSDAFTEIVTNPAHWEDSGQLTLRPRIDPAGEQHRCMVGCDINMCKGEELDAFLQRHGTFDEMIYVGDGSNDFCPVLRLRSQDMVLCRTNRSLEKRIAAEGGLKCQVKYWESAWEIEELYKTF